ncbi:hypothetical protein FGO68_gene3291 [Halteria grandinella]|uniref:Uncharacterized protein n=1 Tax=Halteria grandinella TaxID=5974 RepID=A0A8J8TA27_HALGN|nr:hypothetical protein FGO68_gene3291 [Halteria grandinella]
MGARFQLPIPEGGLIFRDIIFDGIDSVVDYFNTTDDFACVDSWERTCCQVDLGTSQLSCLKENGSLLKPIFNKFQTCFTRAYSGLFNLIKTDQMIGTQERKIRIQNCEFQNMFYELNSLVHVPNSGLSLIGLDLKIENSTFTRINFCGGIFSNNEQFDMLEGKTASESKWFNQAGVIGYAQWLGSEWIRQERTHYNTSVMQDTNTDVQPKVSFVFKNNLVEKFNFLKNPATEGDFSRVQSEIGRTERKKMQNIGLVIDIDGDFDNATIVIANNTFRDTQMFLKTEDQDGVANHCEAVTNAPRAQFQIYEVSQLAMFQFVHLINIRNMKQAKIIIADNLFKNLSLTGPVINIEGEENSNGQLIALFRNTFELIHSYVGTNVMKIQRQFSNLSQPSNYPWIHPETNFHDQRTYVEYGGGILVKNNTFSEIVGCPTTETGLISLQVLDLRPEAGWTQSSSFKLYDIYPPNESYLKYDNMNELLTYLEEDDDEITIHYDLEVGGDKLAFRLSSALFTGNHYENISIGVTQKLDQTFIRGSLIKLYNILSVDFRQETFINVGAFTLEHLSQVLWKIKGEKTTLRLKGGFPYLTQFVDPSTGISNLPFFTDYLSCCLIYAHSILRLRILGENTFENIWLIDRQQAMQAADSIERAADYGLLIYARDFNGVLQIGGGSDSQNEGTTIFKNIVGYLNPYTIERFGWQTEKWLSAVEPEYGVGSILVNTQSDTNSFYTFSVEKVVFHGLYFRSDESSNMVALFDTLIAAKGLKSAIQLKISDVKVVNSHFENGIGYMQLSGHYITVSNLTVINLGSEGLLLRLIPQFSSLSSILAAESNLMKQSFLHFAVNSMLENSLILLSTIVLEKSTFMGIRSSVTSPLISLQAGDTVEAQSSFNEILIGDCVFEGNTGELNAVSSILIDSSTGPSQYKVSFKDCKFINNEAKNGLVYVAKYLSQLNFEGCTFERNNGVKAQLVFLQNTQLGELSFGGCAFQGNGGEFNTVQNNILNGRSDLFIQPSAIKIGQSIILRVHSCNFQGFHYAQTGSFLDMTENSTAYISNSVFKYSSSFSGGLISAIQDCSLIMSGNTFETIHAFKAGVFDIGDNSFIEDKGSIFKKNFAIKNAVLRVLGDSSFNFDNSKFIQNTAAGYNSIGQFISIKNESYFTNVTFQDNAAQHPDFPDSGAKGIEFLSCEAPIVFELCTFSDNLANQVTPNFYLNRALDVQVKDCYFFNSESRDDSIPLFRGGFMQLLAESSVKISNSTFINGRAIQGGAFFLLGDSEISIETSTFQENIAQRRGGVISAESFRKILISEGSDFISNRAIEDSGDILHATNSDYSVTITKVSVSIQYPRNIFMISDVTSVIIKESQFSVKKQVAISNLPSGIVIKNSENTLLSGCKFKNFLSASDERGGGALSISDASNNKTKTKSVIIESTHFEGCSSTTNGGALALYDVSGAEIRGGTVFMGNTASLAGGAVYFKCNDHGTDFSMCQLNITDTKFENNYAKVEGGALKWNIYEPSFQHVTYKNNSAGIYGNDIASVAKTLLKISREEAEMLLQKNLTRRILQEISQKQEVNVQSGGKISMYFVLVDKYGSVMHNENDAKLYISVVSNYTQTFTSAIESETQIDCKKGLFLVQNFVFVGEPNSTQTLKIATDAIDYAIPDNKNRTITNGSQQNIVIIKTNANTTGESFNISGEVVDEKAESEENAFEISISLRGCLAGEELLESGKCHKCDKGTYLITAPTNIQICKECPSNEVAECLGGDSIYPLPGFWRSTNTSENFLKCRNDLACIGRNPPQNESTGACREGYQGILCSDCKIGYSHSGSQFECVKCPDPSLNKLRLFGLGLVLLAIVVLMVRSTLSSNGVKKSLLPVFLRMMLNHYQLFVLTSKFDIAWPQNLQKALSSSDSQSGSQFVSIDCFLEKRNEHQTFIDTADVAERSIFQRVILLTIAPLLIVLASYFTWSIIYLCYDIKRRRDLNISFKASDLLEEDLRISQVNNLQHKTQSEVNNIIAAQQRKEQMKNRVIGSIIILLFLIHPSIIQSLFETISCIDIDGESRLYQDLEILCNYRAHQILSQRLSLPSFFIWGLGIPTFGLYLIFSNRNHFTLPNIRQRFGFLYSGYRIPEAYFWELVIMYRKICIIFISVFLSQSGKIVQALTTLIFLVLCVSLTAFKRPFTNHFLNNLEQLSLMSSALTVYCGLFFISDNSFKSELNFHMSNQTKSLLFALIVLAHIAFLAYWLYHLMSEMRSAMRKRMTILYLGVFLCCNKERLMHEVEVESFVEKLGPFLSSLEKSIEYLKSKQANYRQGDIPIEDEGLRRILLNMGKFMEQAEAEKHKEQITVKEFVRQKTISKMERMKQRESIGNNSTKQRQSLSSNKMFDGDTTIVDSSYHNTSQHMASTQRAMLSLRGESSACSSAADDSSMQSGNLREKQNGAAPAVTDNEYKSKNVFPIKQEKGGTIKFAPLRNENDKTLNLSSSIILDESIAEEIGENYSLFMRENGIAQNTREKMEQIENSWDAQNRQNQALQQRKKDQADGNKTYQQSSTDREPQNNQVEDFKNSEDK